MGVQIGLEQDDGGEAVDGAAGLGEGAGGAAEDTVGLHGGEALVPELDREAGVAAEGSAPAADVDGLSALIAAEVAGEAEQPEADVVLAGEGGQGVQVSVAVLALQGGQTLGGEAQGIAEGEPNAALADVEGEDAARGGGGGGHEARL